MTTCTACGHRVITDAERAAGAREWLRGNLRWQFTGRSAAGDSIFPEDDKGWFGWCRAQAEAAMQTDEGALQLFKMIIGKEWGTR